MHVYHHIVFSLIDRLLASFGNIRRNEMGGTHVYIYIHMIDIQLNTKDMRKDVNTCLFLFLLMSTHLFYAYNI